MSTKTDRDKEGEPGKAKASERGPTRAQLRARKGKPSRGLGAGAKVGMAVLGAILGLGAVFYINNRGPSSGSGSGKYVFQVGEPGPGADAPPIQLPSAQGGSFDLASIRGNTVLLYFQEGLMCQPCWDQVTDIERQWSKFRALGIDQIVTITTDPLDGLKVKVADERIATPVLSDSRRTVSDTYDTTSYGMMGDNFNGHSFIVVGPDGKIRWRADYGGPPNHHMYVAVRDLVGDMRKGLTGAAS